MISVKELKKMYVKFTAVEIDDLDISKGESFGLVGNNGAGKTTFFRMLLDLIRPSRGAITSKELNVAGSEHWKFYTGAYLDEGFLMGHLTPDEYFAFIGELHGLNKAEQEERLKGYEDFFNGEIRGKKAYIRDLSKGNQKKVGIVAAMMIGPEVLILDEPFANLDPSTQIRLKNLLRDYQQKHEATILISSHDLSHVTEVCKRIVVLEKGKVVHDIQSNENTLKELEDYFAVSANTSTIVGGDTDNGVG